MLRQVEQQNFRVCRARNLSFFSSLIAAPSPCASFLPLSSTIPRATCSQACRPLSEFVRYFFSGLQQRDI